MFVSECNFSGVLHSPQFDRTTASYIPTKHFLEEKKHSKCRQGCAPEQSPPHIGTDIPDDLPQWPMKVHCVSLTCDMWSVCVAYVCIWILGTMEANR